MKSKIRVKGLDITVPDRRELEGLLSKYLSGENFNIVFLISDQMLDMAQEDEEYKKVLLKAELRLPQEESALGELMPADGDRIRNYRFIGRLLPRLGELGKTVYLLGTDEERMKEFLKYCEEIGIGEQTLGGYCINPELGPDIIINEINAVNPDIILGLMESPMQETWIMENRTKMSARLYIGIGGIYDRLEAGNRKTPGWVRALHLDKAYMRLKGSKNV